MAKGSFYDGNVGEETQIGNAGASASDAAASAAAAAASAAAALVSEGLADADATATAADLVATNQDTIDTAADVVLTNADVVTTNADAAATTQDAIDTAADVVLTNADVVTTNADAATTTQDAIDTAADVVLTNADAAATALDKIATNADVVLTNADVVTTNADAAATTQDAIDTAADVVLTNADVVTTNADAATTTQDAIDTAADVVLTNADVVLTNADAASTAADALSTAADVVSTAASAASAAAVYDGFDDRYLGSKAVAPALDNDGNALVVGALYFDTVDQSMKVNTASGWVNTSSATLATMSRFVFTASAAQTVFTGLDDGGTDTLAIIVGAEMVTLNGIVLEVTTDYTVTTTSITLTSGAALNDELNVYAFGNFELADHYNKTESDARYAQAVNHYTKIAADARFEPIDATIVKDADIGVTVQGYSAVLGATTASFLTADETKLDGIATSANNYVLPASVVHDTETIDGGTY